MFDTPTPAQPQPEPAALPPQTRAERRMRRLEQMGDQGVEIGRLLTQQARFAAANAKFEGVPDNLPHAELLNAIAAAHARVTRAVAIASAVEDRIDKGLPVLPELDHARRLREDRAAETRERAVDAVEHTLHQRGLDARRTVRLRLDLSRLLDVETADLDRFLSRPFPELVDRLLRDLGLDPAGEDEPGFRPPSPERRMGPDAQRRAAEVTDAAREPTPPPEIPSAFEAVRAARLQRQPSVVPSVQPTPTAVTRPSPSRGRIARAHPPP